MQRLEADGHRVVIVAREKDCTVELLQTAGVQFEVLSRASCGGIANLLELLVRDVRILRRLWEHRIDVAVGTSVSIPAMSRLSRAKSVIFNEDDIDYIQPFAWLVYPFAHRICTPRGVRVGRFQQKRDIYDGYHELAYLHPDIFQPHPEPWSLAGFPKKTNYSLIRLSALQAYHDVGHMGLSVEQVLEIIVALKAVGEVRVCAEAALPDTLRDYQLRIPVEQMHHVLAGAECLVCDSQTMTMEAGVLGVPAFRCNTFVGKCSVIQELEEKYQLVQSFHPDQFEAMVLVVQEVLQRSERATIWEDRRKTLLSETVNVSDWIYKYLAVV